MLNQTRAHPGIARESKFQGPGISGAEVKHIIEEPERLKQEDRADQQRWIEAMAADEAQEP